MVYLWKRFRNWQINKLYEIKFSTSFHYNYTIHKEGSETTAKESFLLYPGLEEQDEEKNSKKNKSPPDDRNILFSFKGSIHIGSDAVILKNCTDN